MRTILIFLFLLNQCSAQLFFQNYIIRHERSSSCVVSKDNGYLIYSIDTGNAISLIKINSTGSIEWVKEYQTNGIGGLAAIATKDNGFLLTFSGEYYSPLWNSYNPAVIFIKTDSVGDTLWTRSYVDGDNIGASVVAGLNKNYFVSGGGSWWPGVSFVFTFEMDSIGNIVWSSDSLSGITCPTSDGGCFLFNESRLIKIKKNDPYFKVVDYNSANLSISQGIKICLTADSGILISFYSMPSAFFLLKADSTGLPVWAKKIPGSIDDLKTFTDGNIILGSDISNTFWFQKLNSLGDTLTSIAFNNNIYSFNTFLTSNDQNFILFGVNGFTLPFVDTLFLYKSDSTGNNFCMTQTQALPDTNVIVTDSVYSIPNRLSMGAPLSYPGAVILINNIIENEIPGCLQTGIQDNKETIVSKVYYNNSENMLNFEISDFRNCSYSVSDLLGRKILSGKINSDYTKILFPFTNGIYIVNVQNNNLIRSFKICVTKY